LLRAARRCCARSARDATVVVVVVAAAAPTVVVDVVVVNAFSSAALANNDADAAEPVDGPLPPLNSPVSTSIAFTPALSLPFSAVIVELLE
jgi:hypothetical protein